MYIYIYIVFFLYIYIYTYIWINFIRFYYDISGYTQVDKKSQLKTYAVISLNLCH